VIYLDTHVVVWLYAGEQARLARTGRQLIESEPMLISPILLLELALLEETGRIQVGPQTVFNELEASLGLALCDLPFTDVSAASLHQQWTRDPFDRLIVGQAIARGAKLVTKDRLIRRHFRGAVW
jgi:PIN domain nuclease of toxin-antitoxin system